MTLTKLNKAIANCNPYSDKELRRYLIGQRRKAESRIKKSIDDVKTGVNIPYMLKSQSGV